MFEDFESKNPWVANLLGAFIKPPETKVPMAWYAEKEDDWDGEVNESVSTEPIG